jgi:hypothetical protein
MPQNLFVDLLAHTRNGYQRFLRADINAHHGKVYTSEFMSLRCHALRDYVNFTNFAYWIKCHFNIDI